MLVFGVQHFIFVSFVATIVPPWIPWHLFCAYFVGAALIAAGLAMMARRNAYAAALLLGSMILSFVVLIHVRLLLELPGDAFAARPIFGPFPARLHNALKDLGLSGAAFLFAGAQAKVQNNQHTRTAFTLGRLLFAIPMIAFGVVHFVHPAFAPGIPPMNTTISFPIPGQPLWSYLTGVFLVVAGVCILFNLKIRVAGTLLGIAILLFLLLVWGPWLVSHPQDISGTNYLKDLGLAGGALILAEAAAPETQR